MKNNNKATVLTIVASLPVVFVLVMGVPSSSSHVYAAKPTEGEGGKGGGYSSNKDGSDKGASDRGGNKGKEIGSGDSNKRNGECSKGIGFVVGNGARDGSGDGHKSKTEALYIDAYLIYFLE
jgi:hypothetical protein